MLYWQLQTPLEKFTLTGEPEIAKLPEVENVDREEVIPCLNKTKRKDRRKVYVKQKTDTNKFNNVEYCYWNILSPEAIEVDVKLTNTRRC